VAFSVHAGVGVGVGVEFRVSVRAGVGVELARSQSLARAQSWRGQAIPGEVAPLLAATTRGARGDALELDGLKAGV
jgi:hypothetical protein